MKNKMKIAIVLPAFGIIPMAGAYADVASTTLTGTRDQLSDTFTEAEKTSLVTAINATKTIADAAQTADEVTNAITTAITNNNTTINSIVEGLETDIDGKADLQGTGAAGVLATVDANGQYVRSGIAATDVATTANVTTIVNNVVNEAVEQITGDISDMATKTWVGEQDYATNTALTTGLAGKQGTLKAGENITLLPDGTISATDTDTTYTAGANITIADGVISAAQQDLSAYQTKAQADAAYDAIGSAAQALADAKTYADANDSDTTYTAGANVTIADGVISATDKDTVYDDTALEGRVTVNEGAITNINTTLGGKANVGDSYTKSESDAKYLTDVDIDGKANTADLGALAALDTVGTAQIDTGAVTLGTLSPTLPAACSAAGVNCALVSSNGALAWEVIVD